MGPLIASACTDGDTARISPARAASDSASGRAAPNGYLGALNDRQRLAVLHGDDAHEGGICAPLLVIAGAGSGKTNTLACRVAHLVYTGSDPQRILLLTFSRRAAAEMERRSAQFLSRALGVDTPVRPPTLRWSGTFHSIGARLLREYAPRIGLHESFTILDRGDAEDLLSIVRHDLGLSSTKARFPTKATCLAIYSRAVNAEAPLGDVLARAFPWCAHWELDLNKLFAAYVEAKQAQNVLDYDDLLLYWSQTLEDAALAREIGDRFDHVLVDEYQDTNRLQASILRSMKPDGRGVTVVGDDAQSIYAFRAATVRNILDFPQQWKPAARVVTLDRNYRSTRPILDASNAVIGLAAERYTKDLWTDRETSQKPRLVTVRDEVDQARYVAERVLEQREGGMALKSQAVLFRSSSHSAQLEIELARRNIPFVKYGGLKFLESAHIKDVLSVLRWADNPRNRLAGFRALRLVQGIGPALATQVLDALGATADTTAAMEGLRLPEAVAGDWAAFRAVLRVAHAATSSWPADLDVVSRWYEAQLHRLYDDAQVREADLSQLQQIASTYPSRERFLSEMALDPPGASSDEAGVPGRDDDYLILSTIHSAKGQEWKAVHVLNVVDGCIPSDMATGTTEEIEEERRLLYVAMTRSKDELHLTVPQRFFVRQQAAHGDRHVYAIRSRFIPEALTSLFEVSAWPIAAGSDEIATRIEPIVPVDIRARVRARWH